MLYFAYGSNLNHEQMQDRCKDSQYIKNYILEGYKLFFCAFSTGYGVANIVKKSSSNVPGCIWEISDRDEKELDYYERFPTKYSKDFFKLDGKKVMFYIIKKNFSLQLPIKRYSDLIYQGYKDCKLDREYLIKTIRDNKIEKK